MFERILYEIELGIQHTPTGRIEMRRSGVVQGKPHFLQIVQLDNGPGYYIYYLDESRQEMNDTDHPSLDDAFVMAELWFAVKRSDWRSL